MAEESLETALWQSFKEQGSQAARQRLFAQHTAFARNIAARHFREQLYRDVEIGDLRQLAYAGLLEAIDRFDPSRGVPFRAFASHRISGSIRDGLSRMSEVREQISWRHRVNRERAQSLSEGTSDDLSTSEAMEKLAEIAVGLAVGFMLEGTGLVAERDDDAVSDGNNAYDSVAWKEMTARLQTELANLPERERYILMHHYGGSVGFDDIASVLHITKGRISQLHRGALALLRKRLSARGHFNLEK
jgi:RNA polymerase sigma factor for flagellar operon FliA